jgi:signal transduction histidine kinase/CheY-like chemotaxis protein/CHASE3 domain sensor protein
VPRALVRRSRAILPIKSLLAILAALLATAVISVLTYDAMKERAAVVEGTRTATAARNALNRLLLQMERAQSGQRGFLLTGDLAILRGHELAMASVPGLVAELRIYLRDDPATLQAVELLASLTQARLAIIEQTVELARGDQADRAIALVRDGRGRAVQDEIRDLGIGLFESISTRLQRDNQAWEESVRWSSYIMLGGAGLLLATLLLVGWLASQDFRTIEGEGWLRRLQLELGAQLQADHRVDSLGEKVLGVLVPSLDAQVGAVYVAEEAGLRRVAGHGLATNAGEHVKRGEGLTGQAAVDGRLVHLDTVPADYLTISSGTGRSKPRQVVILPARVDGEVQAVVELGFLRELDAVDVVALERLGESIATAMRSSRDRNRLEELLDETQRQAEELQAQQEELRVTNEELEQQSTALQLSTAQLENQQAELEEINAQLEDQAASLERQRDELARAGGELQRANEYKSQFLANMSHELRTPLNSSLILAKLLADNKQGNLSAEQVQYANTIYTAGNDLLTLINDILDLSKIEAGMLAVRTEPVALQRLAADLRATFAPLAEQKQLALDMHVAADVTSIDTDPTRLQQILRNLLSNALKFTDRGGATLDISRAGDDIVFAVQDTGIGIAADQHDVIFEAFQQADGATTRKFGGTGLGLSISRDLARLLGGDLRVDSAPGRGSTFTLRLPPRTPARARTARAATASPPRLQAAPPAPAASASAPAARRLPTPLANNDRLRPAPFDDDRAKITREARSLLIIEDDVAFARVLFDLAHELDFLAAVATSGDDGLALARELAPSAVVLDISLPDRSGLAVLDALKRDPHTRHVPVHVVSAHDYVRTALAMGAAGYALKPVERDRLVDAFKKLEERFTRKLRRVLIVEDDPLLRDSTAKLLGGADVETVTAATTAEALAKIKTTTFDCMVLDLNLPDRSGLELLEELTRSEQYSFPPVIVYTGRSLTTEQVHELERFSHSIIIKGARSPERLLDEVTLFLHQVESELPPERQRMLRDARDREAVFDGKRVLVVEDDIRNVFALSAVLEPKGAEVAIARNGREALDYLRTSGDVDLVLMDIMMPEMDGLAATRELRKDPRFAKLPVIALTAKVMADDRDKCLQAGANDYIAKPLDVDKLLSLARVWIRK